MLVRMCVLPYSRNTTSGTSEQSGGCCQGHHSGRSTRSPFCLSSALLLSTPHCPPLRSTMPALLTLMQHHDRVLLAVDRWAFTWNYSLRQERPCERLCCVEAVPGSGTAWRERKGWEWGRGGLLLTSSC